MFSIRRLLFGASIAGLAALCVPFAAPAHTLTVAQMQTCHVSLTGTVTAVLSSNDFSMHANNAGVGNIHIYTSGARVNTNGLSIRPGVYAGVYGCYGPNHRYLNASEVTLATSQAAYNARTTSSDNDNDRDIAGSADVDTCHVSLFGTIGQVRGPNAFMLQTLRSPLGAVYVDYRSARMNANGLTIRPGIFTGLYGCVEQDGRVFKPNEVTLASSESAYSAANHVIALTGTIDEVGRGVIGVRTRYNGHIHVYTSQTGLRIGERVSVRGPFDPLTGVLNAASIAVL
jgi:hypothetical protein